MIELLKMAIGKLLYYELSQVTVSYPFIQSYLDIALNYIAIIFKIIMIIKSKCFNDFFGSQKYKSVTTL